MRRTLIQEIQVGEFIRHALGVQEKLAEVKARRAPPEPGWYPWDSFGTVVLLDQLLTGRYRWFDPMIGADPVLDVGCGDGALSLVFSSLGFRVSAVDNRRSNYNEMRGVAALNAALGSKVRIAEMDIDREWRLPVKRCGLALFLGVLYHLKNPLGVLEALGERARYCLLSTAVTRFAPGESRDISGMPAAFLAGRDGLRGDETNYWIFTEGGLRNVVERAGWEVCCWLPLRDEGSVLWGSQKDERVLCLLRSGAFPEENRTQLVDGWHMLENSAWRWTARRFSVLAGQGTRCLKLSVTVPKILNTPVTLSGAGVRQVLDRPGDHECAFAVSEGLVEFELDRALAADERDGRERGIVVRHVDVSG
jgi:SAM-dependent methyltransferase